MNHGDGSDAPAVVRFPEGREQELNLLLDRWKLTLDDAGQVVLLSADAGLGKTRMVETLAARTASSPRAFLKCRCTAHHQHTAFAPLRELLQGLEDEKAATAQASPSNTEEHLRATLIARLKTLLAQRLPRLTSALNLNPEGQAKKTLEALVGLFLESAKRHPVMLVVEDLEWADPSTLELLSALIHRRPRVSLMVVLTFGPAFQAPWGPRAHLTTIELNRLSRQHCEAILDHLTQRQPLSTSLRREIIARADGVPLYVEELVHLAYALEAPALESTALESTALESTVEADDITQIAVLPLTLKHWLRERIDRLGATRHIVQLAAVLGEDVHYELLQAISDMDQEDLQAALELLATAGILLPAPGPRTELMFKHVTIREAILATLLTHQRHEAHHLAAKTLRDSFPELAQRQPELLAYHYSEANMALEAAAAWCAAAEDAIRQAANLEAASRARLGLELIHSLDVTETRNAQEIALRIALGAATGTAKGYATPEAQTSYDRAVELAWQTPRSPSLAMPMRELVSYYLSRGHIRTAREIAERALWHLDGGELATEEATAHRNLGFARLLEGQLDGAQASLEASLAERPEPGRSDASASQSIPASTIIARAEALSHLALTQWFLGHPDRAIEHCADALTLARRAGDPFCRVFATYRASILHVLRREPTATRELAHELVELANRHGFLFFIAAGMFLEGQALTAQGRAAEGLQMMSGGLDGVWASGMEVGRPRNLALLAEACGRSELVEQGLSLIKEGLAAAEVTGEGHYEAELYRIQGELLGFAEAPYEEVEESLIQARDLARHQGSKSLELRAAISLSRLWQTDDKARASESLAKIYQSFDEGLTTADLEEARELLDELG